MKNIRSWLALSSLGLSLSAPVVVAQTRSFYTDATSYLSSRPQYPAWLELRSNLRENFDDICGDTFCEGDYSNIQPLRFQCSIHSSTGVVGQCVWVFAASNEEILPSTGTIDVQTQTWSCVSPLASGTTITALLTALSGSQPLYAPLPGTTTSLYDGLMDCL
ncbi:hypothetical protein [Stigmatella aurantiaca]|uniref:Conserved uncharacterized protein n=1 Tax=Stigmatella aurantiaca (strain DW4/3-1) TaxID=378806 RepID=E3FM60_STIAD|nr:hypothetical protein [Stigmatella aurantiaca]ADO68064.1 conserved uncharacterized protein [Stigmatella aurantiaca DW4/3-1]